MDYIVCIYITNVIFKPNFFLGQGVGENFSWEEVSLSCQILFFFFSKYNF